MRWIETAGGPFVLVAINDAPSWTGYRGDYEHACAVDGVTGVVGFGDIGTKKTALVIWDEPLRTAYLPERATFVQWMYADSEDWLLRLVDTEFSSAVWEDGPIVELQDVETLFDSATPGVELIESDFLEIRMEAGMYQVQTADIESGDRRAARIHRLVPMRQLPK
ncbi:Imm21 family immunity protein [Sphaerisporangium perillae]|uniref:Imm21 family immunity protein n=1 Tax=Sphaerisporangium perillae TaxID=2935860 RepID=UPI00200CBF23|nr:Imm21 family immunity protein [Sphaerisporangium perillae]